MQLLSAFEVCLWDCVDCVCGTARLGYVRRTAVGVRLWDCVWKFDVGTALGVCRWDCVRRACGTGFGVCWWVCVPRPNI